jgi:hypothetical protein
MSIDKGRVIMFLPRELLNIDGRIKKPFYHTMDMSHKLYFMKTKKSV